MSEFEVRVADAGDNLADAIRTLAHVMASLAASQNTSTPYDQEQFAAVILLNARDAYGDVTRKLNKRQRADLERFIQGIVKGK